MPPEPVQRFDLFLDESGTHKEGGAGESEQRFASQIAGLLVPAGALDETVGRQVLTAIGVDPARPLHGTEFRAGDEFDRLVVSLAEECGRRDWSMVRIANRERTSFGDRAANYTNLLAELVLRIFDRLSGRPRERVHVTITSARVVLREDEGGILHFLEKPEYLRRLREQISRTAVRRGHAPASRRWDFTLKIDSARQRPELMLADLVSNASHADLQKLGGDARTVLRTALARFDFSLWFREDVEAVRRLVDDEAFGLAIVRATDRLVDEDLEPAVRDQLRNLLTRAADGLAGLGSPARDPELQIVTSWLGQEVAHGRDHRSGLTICRLLARDLTKRLRDALDEPAEISWFEYLLRRTELTACNHLGDIRGARDALNQMRPLERGIAERWEHLALFVDAQHHEAVHRTDVQDFGPAAEIAARTARFFEEIGGLFQAAMPQHFPDRVRAKQRGEALGTAMQAAMYHGLQDPAHFTVARAWNDEALDEFVAESDRARQRQYRCQLETLAGELDTAWSWLAAAVGVTRGASPETIAAAIATLPPESIGRQFLLLHAYRLGAAASRTGHPSTAAFVAAFESRFATDPICKGTVNRHPAHAVLRYRTEVLLIAGLAERAADCVTALQQIALPVDTHSPLLALHLVAAQARLAAHCRPAAPARARLLLDCPRQPAGLRQVVAAIAREVDEFDTLRAGLAAWTAAVDALRHDTADRDAWERIDALARHIAH